MVGQVLIYYHGQGHTMLYEARSEFIHLPPQLDRELGNESCSASYRSLAQLGVPL